MYLILINVIIASLLLRYLWNNRQFYILSWKAPGPFSLPLVGYVYTIIRLGVDDTVRLIEKSILSYPGLVRVWFGPFLVYFTTEPKYLQKVLNHFFERPYLIRLGPFPGRKGLIASKVDVWKRHRKAMMPAFNQKILNSFVRTFNEEAVILCKQLEGYEDTRGLDFFDPLFKCTLDIVCETTMGIEMNTQTTHSEYGKSVERLVELLSIRVLNLFHHIDFFWKLSSAGRSENETCKIFREFNTKVLKDKIEDHNESKKTLTVDPDRRLAFLDSMLKMGEFTEEELLDEVGTIITAGSDTSAKTLEFMLITLGMHQDIQEKVFQEVMQIIGPDRNVEPKDIWEMKYTERVCKETLRIFTTAPITARTLEDDLELDADYTLPKGSMVFIFLSTLHRNPVYWPDPLRFDPDRFLPENVAKRHPYAYLPFSNGPRNCIGARFAMMTIMTIIAHVIRKYRFFTEHKTIEDVEAVPYLSMKTMNGSKLWMKRRQFM